MSERAGLCARLAGGSVSFLGSLSDQSGSTRAIEPNGGQAFFSESSHGLNFNHHFKRRRAKRFRAITSEINVYASVNGSGWFPTRARR